MTKDHNAKDEILAVLNKIKQSVKAQSKQQYLPNIIEFCESKYYLDLPSQNVTLFPIQRIILKTFYRGQPGNENLVLTEKEIQILFEEKLDDVITKYHSGVLLRELVLVLGRRCVSENTLVFDANTGESKSVYDWHKEDGELTVWALNEESSQFEKHLAKTIYQGKRDCVRVTLENGDYVDCTPNHPLLTVNGWINVEDLKSGDEVAQNNYIPKPDDGEGLEEYEAAILGYIIGDGNCTTSRCYFTTDDENITQHLQECLDKLSNNMWVKYDNNKQSPHQYALRQREIKFKEKIRSDGRKIGVRDTSDLFKFLTRHGLQGKTAKQKRIPQALFSASSRAKAAFLNAYFSCDGYSGKSNSPKIEVYSVNRSLLEDTQCLLGDLSIQSKIYLKKSNVEIFDKNTNKNYKYSNHESYRLQIGDQQSLFRFCNYIGMKKSYDPNRVITFEVKEPLGFIQIKHIKPIGTKKTYDLSIIHEEIGAENCHNFIINNGLQMHNSGKDFMVSLMALYETMRLLEMPGGNPFSYYKLAEGNPIFILTVATSSDQARILFTEIKEKMTTSEYFQDKIGSIEAESISLLTPHDKRKQKKLLERGLDNAAARIKGSIVIRSGHSNSESLLGKRYYALLLDEVASFKTTGGISSGDRIYSALGPGTADFKRVVGQDEYGEDVTVTDSKIISISSPRAEEGMLFKLYNSAPTTPMMLAFKLPTWKVNILQKENTLRQEFKFMSVNDFNMEFGAEFSGTAGEKFIPDHYINEAIEIGSELSLEQREGGKPGMIYFAHLDPAATSHNYALIVMHTEERMRLTEREGKIVKQKVRMFIVDHIKIWSPVGGQAINVFEVDQYIASLARRFRFSMVSYDNWNSQASVQFLRRKGIPTKITPFRKQYKQEIYDNLEHLLVDNQLALPRKGPHAQLLEMELKCLKRIYTHTGFRIEPNPEAQVTTDDLCDALAGACGLMIDNIYSGYPHSGCVNMPQMPSSGGNQQWNIGRGQYSDQQWRLWNHKFGI